jgi:taurine dioxygenase
VVHWKLEGGLRWRPLEPFGIEIDHDLSKPLTGETADHFVRLVLDHSLVVAHGQSLSMLRQGELLGLLGPILHRLGEDGTSPTPGTRSIPSVRNWSTWS